MNIIIIGIIFFITGCLFGFIIFGLLVVVARGRLIKEEEYQELMILKKSQG